MGQKIKFIETPLAGAYVIELEPYTDDRGLFARIYCQKEFAAIGYHKQIVQINHSVTGKKGTIRGMHYQLKPACESKIIRCIRGRIYDVMVDIRTGSPTLMRWFDAELSEDNMRMVYVPEGCAHGFQSLTDNAELIYISSAFYSPENERGLRFDDPALAIRWPLPASLVSPRDHSHPLIDSGFRGIEI
jgi:dTDP-4-dehydrorhamnose 3,5-epimerase